MTPTSDPRKKPARNRQTLGRNSVGTRSNSQFSLNASRIDDSGGKKDDEYAALPNHQARMMRIGSQSCSTPATNTPIACTMPPSGSL